MARHGENIRKRKDGRWEARYQFFDPDRGQKVYRSVYGDSYAAVKEKRAAALLRSRHQEDTMNCAPVSFAQAAEEWLAETAGKRKYSTYVKYRNIYKKHLEQISGSCLLSDDPEHGLRQKIFDHLSGEKLSESIRRSICCTANQILAFAGEKYSVYVPALKLAEAKCPPRQPRILSRDEQSRLLAVVCGDIDDTETSACKNHKKSKAAILLCLYTGMRLGELCALKWTDIDYRNRTVTVNRTVQRVAAKGHVTKTILMETGPKSERSKRTIPLTVPVLDCLCELKEDRLYVFGGEKPLDPRTMQYRFKKLLKQAEVDDRNFHVLRHVFATNCIENGMDVKALSEILGHADVKITLNRYVHPTMDTKRKQIGMLSDFYGQIYGQ